MNYYTRLQRTSEGYAARVWEELWPEVPTRRAIGRYLASIVKEAAAHTTAWSITLDPASIRVNVGPARLASFSDDKVWFCAASGGLGLLPKWIRDVSNGAIVYRSVNVPSRQYALSPRHVRDLPKGLRNAALMYVVEAARRKRGRSAWTRSHSPGVLAFLDSFLGTTLPRPAASTEVAPPTGELDEDGGFFEGAAVQVWRNAYERSPAARSACIAAYGCRCSVCDVDIAERYGSIADGFIHVHHLVPLGNIRKNYRVDPVRDLRPICPNCHSVIHLRRPPLSIEEARTLVHEQELES